jgi:hypothetical protein
MPFFIYKKVKKRTFLNRKAIILYWKTVFDCPKIARIIWRLFTTKWFWLACESSHLNRIDCSAVFFNEIRYFHLKYQKIPQDFYCNHFSNLLYLNYSFTKRYRIRTHPLNYYLHFGLSYHQNTIHFHSYSHFRCHYCFFFIPPFGHH